MKIHKKSNRHIQNYSLVNKVTFKICIPRKTLADLGIAIDQFLLCFPVFLWLKYLSYSISIHHITSAREAVHIQQGFWTRIQVCAHFDLAEVFQVMACSWEVSPSNLNICYWTHIVYQICKVCPPPYFGLLGYLGVFSDPYT